MIFTYSVHICCIQAALGERLSVFPTARLHICFHWAAVLESAPFVIFTWSRAAEHPDCFLLKAFGHLSGVLQSSWIPSAVKYMNMFVQKQINTFFARRLIDKMLQSKMSSQCWVKVKTRRRPHACALLNGEHVSQIVESKKSFAVSVTASATAKHTSLLTQKTMKKWNLLRNELIQLMLILTRFSRLTDKNKENKLLSSGEKLQ